MYTQYETPKLCYVSGLTHTTYMHQKKKNVMALAW